MKKISAREARQSLTHLDRMLARIGRKRPIPSHRDLREAMRPKRRGSEELIRQDRDAR